MTRFGKLLIFMNLILSVIFAGWAAGIYTQRIDWAPARTLFGEPIEDLSGAVLGPVVDDDQLVVEATRDILERGARTRVELLDELFLVVYRGADAQQAKRAR